MTLKVAVQMDPIDRINIAGDSTFALLLEAQARGHKLFYYTPDRLSLSGTSVVADVETAGELTSGMLVIDRRQTCRARPTCDLLVGCDAAAVTDCMLRGFATAADAT